MKRKPCLGDRMGREKFKYFYKEQEKVHYEHLLLQLQVNKLIHLKDQVQII